MLSAENLTQHADTKMFQWKNYVLNEFPYLLWQNNILLNLSTEQKLPPTVPPDSQSDEDISDFGDDVELPSGEAMPPPLPEDNKPPSPSPPFPEQETAVKQVLVDSDNQDQEPE